MLVALLGSLEQAQQVLLERDRDFNSKTLRTMTYWCAQRARLVQRLETYDGDETVAGRRVVISGDGDRIRRRETTRGHKTKQGRTRYRGA